mgnify:CR=1 FL=1
MNFKKKFSSKRKLGLYVLKDILLEKIFKYFTSQSTEMFLKGRDTISINPQLHGYHERELTDLIISIANRGENDFLIDIGTWRIKISANNIRYFFISRNNNHI